MAVYHYIFVLYYLSLRNPTKYMSYPDSAKQNPDTATLGNDSKGKNGAEITDDATKRDAAEKRFLFFLALAYALTIWFFGARPFLVNGLSMYPTFNSQEGTAEGSGTTFGDYLFIDMYSYIMNSPERLDVVVTGSFSGSQRYLLKRIIGLPNETVRLEGHSIYITTVDGEEVVLDEPYLVGTETIIYEEREIALSDDEYYVLGDNRLNSLDSRIFGPIKKDSILGRVLIRIYPFENFGLFPGSVDT